jgi:hypothetical protein
MQRDENKVVAGKLVSRMPRPAAPVGSFDSTKAIQQILHHHACSFSDMLGGIVHGVSN